MSESEIKFEMDLGVSGTFLTRLPDARTQNNIINILTYITFYILIYYLFFIIFKPKNNAKAKNILFLFFYVKYRILVKIKVIFS